MLEEEIELSGVEQTAYWWTNRLMYMTRYFALKYEHRIGPISQDEIKFLKIFFDYTDKDWRNLYLKLTECVLEDVNDYQPQKSFIGYDNFSQDTEKGRHARLNSELANITGVEQFPDIRLADSSFKDEMVYTTMSESRVWYKSCGVTSLGYLYESTYILSGNEKELDLYNNLLATFIAIKKTKPGACNTELFRQCFCKAYTEQNALNEDFKKVQDLFNKCYNIANERKIVLGNFWGKTFFTETLIYDEAGLDQEYLKNGRAFSNIYFTQLQNLESDQQTSSQNDEGEIDK